MKHGSYYNLSCSNIKDNVLNDRPMFPAIQIVYSPGFNFFVYVS